MPSYRDSAKLVPSEHVDAVLELAYLIAAADGRLDDAELAAYRELVAGFRGGRVGEADFNALLDRFAGNVEHADVEDRVRLLASKLPASAREISFQLALRLSLADLDMSRQEEALTDALIEALGLTADRADELTAEVYAGLDAGSDE